MVKKSFWKGFTTGGILCILSIVFVFYKFTARPDISLNQLEVYNFNGDKVELNKDIGKPLVVNYWATWCAPCIKEFPYFEDVKQELGEDVNFVMISDETLNKIIKFSESNPYSFNYLRSNKSPREYGINGIPTTYFYNAQGELITKHAGNLDIKSLKELIEQIK